MASIVPRIADVRPIPLRAPLDQPVRMALGEMRWRNGMLVEITTSAGVTGIGESWVNFPSWAPVERVATITQGLRPLLVDEPIDDPRRLHHKLVGVLHRLALQWGAIGPIYQAISGVDLALWDLAGKLSGVPVWQMLGAPRQDVVPAYASGLGPDVPEEQAATAVTAGFAAVKLKVGFGRARDERNLRAMREAIGSRLLFADANQGWSVDDARAMAPILAAVGADWIEEPLPVDDGAWSEVSGIFTMPVAGGENLYGSREFARWTASGRLGVLQPDVGKCGGITAAYEVLMSAQPSSVRLAPHYFGCAIGLAATVHLFAALPPDRRVLVEYDVNPNPLREALLDEPLLVGGNLRVPDRPGLGVTLDAHALEQFHG
jgi:L-alanine-DL-glutamate epimerase-like enolase superfamily enzyme